MQNLFSKKPKIKQDHVNRKSFSRREIFLLTYQILLQTNYSRKLTKMSLEKQKNTIFLTRIKNRCVFSGTTSSINFRSKMSRILFSKYVKEGKITGFFKAVW